MHTEFGQWIDSIKQHRKGDTFSPHKPLTLLWALASALRGEQFIEYNRNERDLENFFKEVFGKTNIHYPLFRLVNDNMGDHSFWEISPSEMPKTPSGDISISDARRLNFKAGFSLSFFQYLQKNPSDALFYINYLLHENFPETLHETILTLLNIKIPQGYESAQLNLLQSFSKKRDPEFRSKVMAIYDNKCAFCDLKIYFNNTAVSLEAAHIKWKAYNGPCDANNGLCLCPTHHYAFDKGFWSLSDDLKIVVSDLLQENNTTKKFFHDFHGKSIKDNLLDKRFEPSADYILWHKHNILRT